MLPTLILRIVPSAAGRGLGEGNQDPEAIFDMLLIANILIAGNEH